MANGPTSFPSTPSITNQVIVDGTSYSGADIKAVIHIYGPAAVDKRIQDLEERINTLNADNSSPTISDADRLVNLQVIRHLSDQIESLRNERPPFVTKTLAEIQTLSVSTYREKYPVRALSTTYPKGFTRGPRTIAGSMVFTVFDKNVLYELLAADATEFDADRLFTTAIIDQLPPFDITIAFANELGQTSRMTIYGVEFVSEGQTMSIHDLFIENTCQYVARDIDPMTKEGDRRRKVLTPGTKLASDLGRESAAKEYKELGDPFARFTKRNNPFK